MSYLKKIGDDNIQLLRDVFEVLDDDYYLNIHYHLMKKIQGCVVEIVFSETIFNLELLKLISDLSNMAVGYCGFDYFGWDIYSNKTTYEISSSEDNRRTNILDSFPFNDPDPHLDRHGKIHRPRDVYSIQLCFFIDPKF